MVALSSDRNTSKRDGNTFAYDVAANVKIFTGALVALVAGNAAPGSVALNLVAVGRAMRFYDNTGGAAAAFKVEVERGVFRFANSAAGDAIAKADIGANCFIVDDQTVAKTNGTNTRSIAGKIEDVDAGGVWVRI